MMNMNERFDEARRLGVPAAYRIEARSIRQMQVSRHGINQSQGGQLLGSEDFQWPDTDFNMALDMVRERYPLADVAIVRVRPVRA